jgi:hypothetical protein
LAAIPESELADDKMIAEVVGAWAKNKHEHLCRYIDISRAARKGFVHSFRSKTPLGTTAGAAYIDLVRIAKRFLRSRLKLQICDTLYA